MARTFKGYLKIFFTILQKSFAKIFIILVKIYQIVFSLLFGANKCRFTPTCSNYMIEAIQKKGLIKGIFLGVLRISRCNPFSKKVGFDPLK